MHIPDGGRHLLNRGDIFDHETVRQKPLIDQLHDLLITRFEPDRAKMLTAYIHKLSRFILRRVASCVPREALAFYAARSCENVFRLHSFWILDTRCSRPRVRPTTGGW